MNINIETDKHCYTCLKPEANLISLHKSGMDNILQNTLDISPLFHDRFNWICYKCKSILKNFEKFKTSCKEVDLIIKNYIVDPKKYVDSLKFKNNYINLSETSIIHIDLFSDISSFVENNCSYINLSESKGKNEENLNNVNVISEITNESPVLENNIFEIYPISNIKPKKKKKKQFQDDFYDDSEFQNIISEDANTNKTSDNAYTKYRKPRKCKIKSDYLYMNKSKLLKVYLSEDEQKQERQQRMTEDKYINAPYKCELCVISFRREFTLENHMEKHKEERGPYICSICQQRFGNERQFKLHTSIHSIRLVCYACGTQLRDRGRLADHLAWHAGHKYPCKMCNATFVCRTTLNNHIRVKHKEIEYECQFCGRVFKIKERLKEHESRHSKSPAYACNICNKQFYSAANLSNHKITHSTMRHFYCVECDLHFKSASILKNHLEKSAKHIDPSSLRFPCDQCNKRFRTSELLTHHIDASHLKRKKFSCEICAASYASHQGLNFHRRLAHQGYRLPKSHTCTICQRSFTAKALLTNHMRVHTGEKPFECSECYRKFSQKSSLRTHIKLVHLKLKRIIKKKNKTKILEDDSSKVNISGDKIEILNLYPEENKNWECKVTNSSLIQQDDIIDSVCDISVPINIEHTLYETSPR